MGCPGPQPNAGLRGSCRQSPALGRGHRPATGCLGGSPGCRAICCESFQARAEDPEPRTLGHGSPPTTSDTCSCEIHLLLLCLCCLYSCSTTSWGRSHCPEAVPGMPSEPSQLSQQPGPPSAGVGCRPTGWRGPSREGSAAPGSDRLFISGGRGKLSPRHWDPPVPGKLLLGLTALRPAQAWPRPVAAWLGRNAEAAAESTTCSGKGGLRAQVWPCLARPSWSHREPSGPGAPGTQEHR